MMGDGVRLWWEGRREPTPLPLFPLLAADGELLRDPEPAAWRNLLAHADNLVLLGHLTEGSLAAPLRVQGGIALIYIDPPYAMETDFHVGVGDNGGGFAFSDSWGSAGAYLQFMYDRLVPMRSLLREDGVLCVHCDGE